MKIRCMNDHGSETRCTATATERLGWYDDEDDILWYSFLCKTHAVSAVHDAGAPEVHDQQVPHTEAVS